MGVGREYWATCDGCLTSRGPKASTVAEAYRLASERGWKAEWVENQRATSFLCPACQHEAEKLRSN